jgi:hypothetical protein
VGCDRGRGRRTPALDDSGRRSVIGIWLEARQLRIAAALAFIAIGLWMLIRT